MHTVERGYLPQNNAVQMALIQTLKQTENNDLLEALSKIVTDNRKQRRVNQTQTDAREDEATQTFGTNPDVVPVQSTNTANPTNPIASRVPGERHFRRIRSLHLFLLETKVTFVG